MSRKVCSLWMIGKRHVCNQSVRCLGEYSRVHFPETLHRLIGVGVVSVFIGDFSEELDSRSGHFQHRSHKSHIRRVRNPFIRAKLKIFLFNHAEQVNIKSFQMRSAKPSEFAPGPVLLEHSGVNRLVATVADMVRVDKK